MRVMIQEAAQVAQTVIFSRSYLDVKTETRERPAGPEEEARSTHSKITGKT